MGTLVALFALALVVGALLILPLLALKLLLHLVMGVVLLPFRLLGAAFKLVFGLVGGLKLLFSGAFLLGGLLLGLAVLVFLPLLPLLLLGGFLWLAAKAFRPQAAGR